MQLLLDTHVLLWWLGDDPKLSSVHRSMISNSENWIFVSSVTIVEVSIRASLGKLDAPNGVAEAVTASGFEHLGFEHSHAEFLRELPWIHRDPFDRMLISQAVVEKLTFMTMDARNREYAEETALKVL